MLPPHIEAKIAIEPNTGCWLWFGSTNSGGYGNINKRGKTRQAHRVVYEIEVGPIPEGLELDHICRQRCCVNPRHLEPVTHSVNMTRSPINATHWALRCTKGHVRTPENTWVSPTSGERKCRQCTGSKKRTMN